MTIGERGHAASDLARKFGLIYAGGRLGIQSGLLPWKRQELLDAIAKCYNGARALFLDDELLQKRGDEVLRSFLATLPKRSKVEARDINEFAGFAI